MQNMSIDPTSFLIDLISRMIEILRAENSFAFSLLKEVTANKQTVMRLDDITLFIAAENESEFTLSIRKAEEGEPPQLITTSDALRNIVDGTTTLDHELVSQNIYLAASLEEMLGMYRLVICLLINGIVNRKLRDLWNEFVEWWPIPRHETLQELISQLPVYGNFIRTIPEEVMLCRYF